MATTESGLQVAQVGTISYNVIDCEVARRWVLQAHWRDHDATRCSQFGREW